MVRLLPTRKRSTAHDRAALSEAFVDVGRRMGAATVSFNNAVAELAGLNRTDYECMDVLDAEGPCTAGRLAEATGLTTGAITGVVDRLEAAGLARRSRDPDDRRRVIVELSGASALADEMMAEAFGPLMVAMQEVVDGASDEELASFARLAEQTTTVLRDAAVRLRAKR